MGDHTQLEVLAFTDPVCTWCWGSEPVLRKLEVWYGDQVKLRYVMGGLVKDIRAFNKDLELTRRYGVRGFPTFVFLYEERELKYWKRSLLPFLRNVEFAA